MESLVTLQQLQSYYKNKKVFVTGHTGFKGSWLITLLQYIGAKVKGYALEPEYNNSMFNTLKLESICESVIGDIRNEKKFEQEILDYQPDYIFHLAAQPLVRRSYLFSKETYDINVIGTANLFEALKKLDTPCSVVIITTDKVYKNKEQNILYKEDDVLGGYDPYSSSKACVELLTSSYRASFFNPEKYASHKKAVATARAGNVIGGGDWNTDRIVPDIIRALQANEKIIVRNPNSVRPWQHVLEPLTGYLVLGAQLDSNPLKYAKAFNFGPNPKDHLSVKEIVELAIKTWGSGEWMQANNAEQPHEASQLQLDINLAKEQLGWEPKLNAASAIEWTIDWYKRPSSELYDYTIRQIENYLAL